MVVDRCMPSVALGGTELLELLVGEILVVVLVVLVVVGRRRLLEEARPAALAYEKSGGPVSESAVRRCARVFLQRQTSLNY